MFGSRPITTTSINSLWTKLPVHSMEVINSEPSVTFSWTKSIGAVPTSETWSWRDSELDDADVRRTVGGPGRTVLIGKK